VTGAIVSIQIPGDRNHERYLRTVTEDTAVETIRRAVTAMMKKPSDFEIGSRTAKPTWKRAVKGDEDAQVKEAVQQIAAAVT
jgi:hypothetical protein